MTENQLINNEILVKPEDFLNLDEKEKEPWVYHETWIVTICTNEHYYELKEKYERLKLITEFIMDLLNNQKEFLQEFFYYKKNKIWPGSKTPPTLPMDLNKIDSLNISWYPEVQTKSVNNYLHVHVYLDIGHYPTKGLSITFNYDLLQSIVEQIFGHKFSIDAKFAKNTSRTMKQYVEKTVHPEE